MRTGSPHVGPSITNSALDRFTGMTTEAREVLGNAHSRVVRSGLVVSAELSAGRFGCADLSDDLPVVVDMAQYPHHAQCEGLGLAVGLASGGSGGDCGGDRVIPVDDEDDGGPLSATGGSLAW